MRLAVRFNKEFTTLITYLSNVEQLRNRASHVPEGQLTSLVLNIVAYLATCAFMWSFTIIGVNPRRLGVWGCGGRRGAVGGREILL